MEIMDTDDEKLGDCIQACLDTYAICVQTKAICIGLGGKHADPTHINKLTDCAALCQVTADLLLRGSSSFGDLCRLTAPVCNECAANCESFEDEFMKACAEECRDCADLCLELGESIVIEGDVAALDRDIESGGSSRTHGSVGSHSDGTVDDEPVF